MNKTLAVLLAAALASPLVPAPPALAETAAVTGQAQVLESIHLAGVIEVDASGRVEQVKLQPNQLLPSIETKVLQVMQNWTFAPYVLDGTPRRIRTSVYARLDQLKSAAGYQLVLATAEFGQPLAQNLTPPRYPAQSLGNRIAAEVLLRLTLDNEGGVAIAEPVSARVLNRNVRSERRHRHLVEPFARASVEAVQSWRFDFVEPRTDGTAHQMLVPMTFTISGMYAGTGGRRPENTPVLFELSTPLGRPLEALAREAESRRSSVPISPTPSPLKLLSPTGEALTM
ncbi:energy transducer TonB family protein [Aquimonas voraii]|uniref:TonB family C-terminal domain-containing protein n=1 Tax=Aquimonas voraii TaxID=265719 RepID=A0A1G6XW11_9GAMM|nr:energy transducer TonB [Aquimonas voraii]SDD82359.1 hypothetical protein SAMN04488509_1082 [Aquimonas voraii]